MLPLIMYKIISCYQNIINKNFDTNKTDFLEFDTPQC